MFGFQNRFDILRATKSFTRTGPKKQKTKKKPTAAAAAATALKLNIRSGSLLSCLRRLVTLLSLEVNFSIIQPNKMGHHQFPPHPQAVVHHHLNIICNTAV